MAFIRINRKLFDHSFWKENREYSRAEAWIDLIQLVSFTPDNKKMIDGVLVRWGRGQYPVSYRFLSHRWNWSTHKVRIFIELLKEEQQAAMTTARRTTILTLCKYDHYNPISQADVQGEGQADGKLTAQSIRIEEDQEDKGFKENLIKEKTEEEKFEEWQIENNRKNRELLKMGEYAEPEDQNEL